MKKIQDTITHPHDRFFKMAMSDKRVAKDFFETHLPQKILTLVDLTHLELQVSSYVNDLRQESIADILYKTQIAGFTGYLYLIVDHQSTPDELMPFRVLKYTCNIIDQHLKDTGKKRLPMILPMIVYHGKRPWTYSTNINDLVDSAKELIDAYFLKPFFLIDLNLIDDEILKQRAWSGAMNLTLKRIFAKDMLPYLLDIIQLLKKIEQSDGKNFAEIVLTYILDRGELANKQAFFELIQTQLTPEVGEKVMTIAEQLKIEGKNEGRLEGKLEGRVEGRLEGRLEGKLEVAEQLLSEGIKPALVARMTKLPLEKIKDLAENQQH